MPRFAIATCTAQYGRYRSAKLPYADRTLLGCTAKNRPSTIDFGRQRPIEGEIDRRRSISAVDGRLREKSGRLREKKERRRRRRKKEKRRGEEENLAPSSPSLAGRAGRKIEATSPSVG
ncbi:hypothetical protein BHE74_00011786 [Ensete ventricosum]|uniref:Uncharacterized protein n=1 Tax=Ensete ventricosum TaxID=4639 RepID=A0A445MFU9_ENSVE|nr:hypothetical protein BHE74_00011786 [Ensete ventricosum]RZR73167.1 hypothetical protein BHM03_00020983 [Ensete ventricosum]